MTHFLLTFNRTERDEQGHIVVKRVRGSKRVSCHHVNEAIELGRVIGRTCGATNVVTRKVVA